MSNNNNKQSLGHLLYCTPKSKMDNGLFFGQKRVRFEGKVISGIFGPPTQNDKKCISQLLIFAPFKPQFSH